MEDDYEDNPIEENPSEFIKKAAEERAMNLQREAYEREILQRQAMQSIIDRKIRDNQRKVQEQKKIQTIEDVLKRGDKVRWEIVNNAILKGFVKNILVFEIKKGYSIYNLYIKDKSFLLEGSKTGYTSCSYNLEGIKGKAEKLLII
jgi:ATPase subunit of ABC transporter with duplicated ATPase domains